MKNAKCKMFIGFMQDSPAPDEIICLPPLSRRATVSDSASVSRRRFVGRAGLATVAVPWIVSARALGREDRPAAGDRLTVGFIGVGKQNLGHLGKFLGRPEVQVVAVCDVD